MESITKSQSSGIVNGPVNQIPPIPHDTGNIIKSDSSISGLQSSSKGEPFLEKRIVIPPPHKPPSLAPDIITSPYAIIKATTSISKLLADIIDKAKLYTIISGKKYVRVEGWETLGALLLCSVEIIKVEEYKNGYRAEAIVRNQDGKIISNGIGICLRSENNWKTRDDYAICSMAQTRAIGKAYRLGFAWIMSLAGYEVCPAEEMERTKMNLKEADDNLLIEELANRGIDARPIMDFKTKELNDELTRRRIESELAEQAN